MLMFNWRVCGLLLLILLGKVLTGTVDDFLSKFQQSDYVAEFERIELDRYNKNFFRYLKITTFKYNRTCPVVNMTWELLTDIERNPQYVVQGYKFASNEYRLFPAIRFQMNYCEALQTNVGGMGSLLRCGNFSGCPIRKGKFHICNWAMDSNQLPPLVPNGKYMMEMQLLHYSTELLVLRLYGSVSRSIPYEK